MTRCIWLGALALLVGLAGCGSDPETKPVEATPVCSPGDTLCGLSCVSLLSDTRHCGACDNTCGEGESCVDGACAVVCPVGQELCDGACVNLSDSADHCGSCGKACTAGEVCADGNCQFACGDGQTACDGGCHTLETSRQHCGACGNACGAGEVCADGACRIGCPAGQTACDGGCWDLQNSNQHCGGCGNACDAGESCVDGACAAGCPAGQALCDGACTVLSGDRANCGACGNACEADEVCTGGSCELACASGMTECGGACKDTSNDRNNCGGCGNVCGAQESCVDGACVVQCGGFASTLCDDTCTNTDVDPANCGACGNACAAGEVCSMGTCASSCADDADVCNGSCTSLAYDPANCGGCGNACADRPNATGVCASFNCQAVCDHGYADCDDDLSSSTTNGCEVLLFDDPTNCGACGNVCPALPHASTACFAGSCTIGLCDAGYTDCNGDPADGCEANVDSDANNCGVCGNICPAGQTCSAGGCLPVTGDTCSNAVVLTGGSNSVTWVAFGREYITSTPSCGSGYAPTGPDLVMQYTAPFTGPVTVTIPKPADTRWHLLIEDDPCGTLNVSNAMVCFSDWAPTQLTTTFSAVGGQTYFFYLVDSTSGTLPLDPTITININDPGPSSDDGLGDSCLNPAPIAAGTNTIDWAAVGNHYMTATPHCGLSYAPTGPDVVLKYTALFDGKVDVTLAKPASQRWHMIASSGACGSLTPELACISEYTATTMGVSFPVATGNDYFVYVVDTTSGSLPISDPLTVTVNELNCNVMTVPALVSLAPTDGSTATTIRPEFVATFDQAVAPVGTITLTGNLGTSRSITLPSPDVTFSTDGKTMTIKTEPFASGETVNVSWSGLTDLYCGSPVAPPTSWSVTVPVVPCTPGSNGMVGTTMTRIPLGAIGTFDEYYVAADQDPNGWVYVGGTTKLFRTRKDGIGWSFQDVSALLGLTSTQLGYTMVIDGPSIYVVDDTTSTTLTTERVRRITADGGLTWELENAATFATAPNDDFRAAAAYGGRIYMITEEFSAGTEIWSFDGTGTLPAPATRDVIFGGADYQYCEGLAIDAAYAYTTCRLQRATTQYATIRVDRATGTVTELSTAIPGNVTAMSIHVKDADADGLADYVYVGSNQEAGYFICAPQSTTPYLDVLYNFGTGTGNYGLGFDPVSNALWAFDDDTLEFVKIQ